MMNLMLLGAISSTGDTLFVLVSFLILLLLVKKFAWKPLTAILDERENQVASNIDNAEQAKKNAHSLVAEQEEKLQKAKEESSQIINQAKQSSARMEKDLLSQAKDEVARMKEQAENEIEVEKQKTLASAKNEISSISVQIAEKLLKRELDSEGQAELIDEFIGRLAKSDEVK